MLPAAPRSSGNDRPPRGIDVRLAPLLQAETDADIALAIERLLADVMGVARDVVRRELNHSPAGAAYMEDVLADVRLRLIRKLRKLSPLRRPLEADEDAPVENVLAYVSVVAENACYAFLRAQYPERTRFRNRVRYAVSHHPSTSLTREEGGLWRCQTRRAVRRAPAAGATESFLDRPAAWLSTGRIDPKLPLPALVDVVLAGLDRPVELDRLVDALASVLGIVDLQPTETRAEGAPAREMVDPAPAIGDVLEQRQALLNVWKELIELPVRQRVALLLNLRDPEGGAVLHMLPGTGVVTMAGIAAALEIDEAALTTMWDALPLDDFSIAARLDLTRQQIINLRKSARARLARRLRGPA